MLKLINMGISRKDYMEMALWEIEETIKILSEKD
jgi:hypothetical protein